MPFRKDIQKYIYKYCANHLPDEDWLENEFNFIKKEELRNRIKTEYKNARNVYKIFEGLEVENELLLAEVRLQILMYASIYETILHYIIFDEYYRDEKCVKDLLVQKTLKEYSIPQQNLKKISNELHHDQKNIITCYRTTVKRDITKVRFDEKCIVAKELGILKDIKLDMPKIDERTGKTVNKICLCNDLISIYEMRNAIHIHAEIKKDIEYHLYMSKLAYKRMRPFIDQVKEKLKNDNKI